ncbi:aldehyde dehydrogenase [Haloplanus halophilus]|uniref:aldehyde dehydrogenase n=1 Tax=Haloplanus halophilus TaxID=2949993 RepID=UPI0020411645|nr:aldehyde dehydrogenase [Haloplanus sp. GDY1]
MSQTDDDYEYDLFVDGAFRPGASGDRIDVSFPYDGTVWATVPRGTATDVDRAVAAARDAFEGPWSEFGGSERRRVLDQIADAIDAHTEELAELETRQNGKLVREMRGQMESLSDWYRYYGGLAEDLGGRTIPVENKSETGGMLAYTRKEPLGVVGAITPWNSPLMLTTWKLAPALAAGNTFVHKPSEETPVSALRFAELVAQHTDLPDGVYNVVPGHGTEAGAALVDHEGVDKLAFTGSTTVGRDIASAAGERLIPVTLELGGKSPNIVFESADLENAVNGVVKGIFAATGQTCVAGSRVFVHESIHDEFVDAFTERAADVTLGNPLDPETQMGPVAFRDQWETVRSYVERGAEEGATVAFGGDRPDDLPGECFIEPTVLVDVDNDMTVAREEIFGPVASVIPFADEDEVVDLANDTDYGLAAGVWTEDMRQANRLVERIDAGMVWVNEYRAVSHKVPFGGYKDSGIGRENGAEALDEYVQTKSVWYDQSGDVSDPFSLG